MLATLGGVPIARWLVLLTGLAVVSARPSSARAFGNPRGGRIPGQSAHAHALPINARRLNRRHRHPDAQRHAERHRP
jgi:hypothetical protein